MNDQTPSKDRPILFSAPMVRAILEGRKTVTRRVVKPQPVDDVLFGGGAYIERKPGRKDGGRDRTCVTAPMEYLADLCPYGKPGDRLWVRETWRAVGDAPLSECTGPDDIMYRASCGEFETGGFRFRPSIFMPRWASRITLEVTGVRVERLQDISEEQAEAEGAAEWGRVACDQDICRDLRATDFFELLWCSINGRESWTANPWVWVVEFKKVVQ